MAIDDTVRQQAIEMLQRGVGTMSVARATKLSRWTVTRLRKSLRLMPEQLVVDLAAELEQTAEVATTTQQELEQTTTTLAKASKRFEVTRARERRKDQELRNLRKKDEWQQRCFRVAYGVYDVFPESVWTALLAGDAVPVRFDHPRVPDVDRDTVLVLDDEYIDDLRLAITTRETYEMGAQTTDPDKALTGYGRALRVEVYGG